MDYFEIAEDETPVFELNEPRQETFDEWMDRVEPELQEWLDDVSRSGWCLRSSIGDVLAFYWNYIIPTTVDTISIVSLPPYRRRVHPKIIVDRFPKPWIPVPNREYQNFIRTS